MLSNPGESVGVARLTSSGGDAACHANLGRVQLGYKQFKLSTWVHLLPPSDCLMFRVPPLSPWYHIVLFCFLPPGKEIDTQLAGLTIIAKGQLSNTYIAHTLSSCRINTHDPTVDDAAVVVSASFWVYHWKIRDHLCEV